MRPSCFFSSLVLLLALQAPPDPPAVSAAWLGDDALSVTWAGPPGACLYYERAGGLLTHVEGACGGGVATLRTGEDHAVRPEPGGRLLVAENLAQPLAEGYVPWRVVLTVVVAPQLGESWGALGRPGRDGGYGWGDGSSPYTTAGSKSPTPYPACGLRSANA